MAEIINLGGMYASEMDICLSERHTCLSEKETFLSEIHIYVSPPQLVRE